MVATMIAAAYFAAGTFAYAATVFAVNFALSMIVTRIFSDDPETQQDMGVRQQVPPSAVNAIPVVYGNAYMGGTFVDAVLTEDQKTMYYVLAISSISPNGQFSFDTADMYYGDRLITFGSGVDSTKVISLTDEANNVITNISGNLYINLYTSTTGGVISSTNGASAPSTVMGGSDIAAGQRWTGTRQMNGLAFAIVKLIYNRDADTTQLSAITFKVAHTLNGTGVAKAGDVWFDYMTNDIYGGAVNASFVDSASATALNVYGDQTITFTNSSGNPSTQARYRINGVLDAGQSVLSNVDRIMSACDSWLTYNAALGQWSVVINKAESASYAFNDNNIIGEIRVSATDITSSINQVEARFPFKGNRDQANFVNIETPSNLLYPNEPVNKYSITYDLVNDSVQTHYLANRLLEQAREDLIVGFNTTYFGIQVDAGNVVSVTNSDYGWNAKLFRVMKVNEASMTDGSLGARLELSEYNAQVYDDQAITQFTPVANSGLPDPSFFGVIPAPTIFASYPTAPVPSFDVQPYIGTASIASYAEIWYSAFATPTSTQIYLGGITALVSNGVPYVVGQTLPTVNLQIPAGNWYFFTRIVNSLATSQYSTASAVFNWRPTTFQYVNRWVAVAYATNATGTTGFSLNPRNKTFYGLLNNTTANGSANPADYTWYAGSFGTDNYLLIANRSNRKFSFAVGNAGFANLGGAFVPTATSIYDSSEWSGLEDGDNYIDLDFRTGQLTRAGTTSTSSADGLLSVVNNTSGSMVVSLEKFLNFGSGVYSKTFSTATLTIDVFGRVVGFTQPDDFFYTELVFTATASQTVFSLTHVVGQMLVFQNGILLDTTEYAESASGIVMNAPCPSGTIVVLISMRAVSTDQYYENLVASIVSSASNSIVLNALPYQIVNAGDLLCFAALQPDPLSTPTTYTVQSINNGTKTITFTGTISGATNGFNVYRKRSTGASYAPFSRYTTTLTSASSYTPTNFSFRNGFESLYVNGCQFSEIDYDLSGNTANGFPANITGDITVVQYSENNLGVPASNVTNTVVYSTNGALSYIFPNNPLSMEVYANGILLTKGSIYDYTASSSGFNLVQAFNNNFTLLNQQTFFRIGPA